MNTISMLLEDSLLKTIAQGAGCSNTLMLLKEEKRAVQEALGQIQKVVGAADISDEQYLALTALEDQLKVAIAPHKTLPPEVLNCIFSALVPLSEKVWHPRDSGEYERDALPFQYLDVASWNCYEPHRVRGVCRSWRRIALEQRDLWCNIQIRWPQYHQEYQEISLEFLVDKTLSIIPKTGPINLRLVLYLPTRPPYHTMAVHDALTKLLASFGRRLSSLSFSGDVPQMDMPWYLPHSVTFPSLKAIKVEACSNGLRGISQLRGVRVPGNSGPMRTLFHHSPKLQEIELRMGPFEPVIFSQPIPWSQITNLSLGQALSLKTLLPALSNATNLRRLSLVLNSVGGIVRDEIDLPRLEDMVLQVMLGSEGVFDALRVPDLSKLTVNCSPSQSIEKIRAMIVRSGCSITEFADQWSRGAKDITIPELFYSLAASMPKLRSLKSEVLVGKTFVQALGSGTILPCLEMFSCKSVLSTAEFADALEAGLKSRDPNAPVEHSLQRISRDQVGNRGECVRKVMRQRMDALKDDWGIDFMSFGSVNVAELFQE